MTQAPIDPRHKDEAERLLSQSYDRILTIAQTLANLEAARADLAEIDRIAVAGGFAQCLPGDPCLEIAAIAAPFRASDPVAWMYVNADGECEQIDYGPDNPGDEYFQPLYATPQPAAVDGLVEALLNGEHEAWVAVAKLAGARGIRYRSNTELVAFIAALAQIERKPEDGNG